MSLVCRNLIQRIEEKYPLRLAEKYDNVGLIIGDYSKEIRRVLLALDINEDVVNEAISFDVDMIISHHPLIFKPIKRLIRNDPSADIILRLIKSDINVYAIHTNFDNAMGGMNDILAGLLELQDTEPLANNLDTKLFKLAVFVPKSHENIVREALLSSGAGHIGKYSHCSFNLRGVGTFKPLEGADPFIGSEGILEEVEEVRIETIVEQYKIKKVLEKMIEAHPYEEVAYDIIPLENRAVYGTGRIGKLKEEKSMDELCTVLKNRFGIPYLSVGGAMDKRIRRVAIVGGAGSEFIPDAAEKRADVLITGDIKHHEAMDAVSAGLNIIDAGHYFTEFIALPYIERFICSFSDVECRVTSHCTNQLRRI